MARYALGGHLLKAAEIDVCAWSRIREAVELGI
jgi:hypothetical protein